MNGYSDENIVTMYQYLVCHYVPNSVASEHQKFILLRISLLESIQVGQWSLLAESERLFLGRRRGRYFRADPALTVGE